MIKVPYIVYPERAWKHITIREEQDCPECLRVLVREKEEAEKMQFWTHALVVGDPEPFYVYPTDLIRE